MRILVILLVIIVSFAAGHYSYPLLKHNQMQPSPLKHQADQVENSVAKSSETLNPNQHQEPSSVASQDKKKSINGSEHVESNKNAATDPASSQSSAGQEIATTGNVDNIGNHAVVSEEAIRELKQWQTQHKQALKELFNDRVPEHFAEGFLAKATEDNAFLNEVQQNLNPDRNDQWHMQMEQRLSDMIQLHELSNRIEILSLTCKQSTCEIVGKAFEEGPWTTIYMSMIRRLLQAGDSLNMQKGKRVTYFDQEQEYFYSQLVFE